MRDTMNHLTTSDLIDFGYRERALLLDILKAWQETGLPGDFEHKEVRPVMNKSSGFVFLTNSEFQVAMMNGNKLESFYSCVICGHEGFKEDCTINEFGCDHCHPTPPKFTYQIFSLDVWAGEEEGTFMKNNFFKIQEIEFEEKLSTETVIPLLIEEGLLNECAREGAYVENHDCEWRYFEVIDKETQLPLFDIKRI